jgi:hypothetical protein
MLYVVCCMLYRYGQHKAQGARRKAQGAVPCACARLRSWQRTNRGGGRCRRASEYGDSLCCRHKELGRLRICAKIKRKQRIKRALFLSVGERGTRVAICTALQVQVYLGRWEGGSGPTQQGKRQTNTGCIKFPQKKRDSKSQVNCHLLNPAGWPSAWLHHARIRELQQDLL